MADGSSNDAEIKAASVLPFESAPSRYPSPLPTSLPSPSEDARQICRLTDKRAVGAVFEKGQKRVIDEAVIFYRVTGGSLIRFAVHTRRVLGGAVERNRVRRVFKEAVRAEARKLKRLNGVDMILDPRKRAVGLGMREIARRLAPVFLEVASSKAVKR